jgi:HlyD family secretion protein
VWKWVLGSLVLLALICGGGGFFVTSTAKGKEIAKGFKPKEKITEVRMDGVQRGDLIRVVSAPGTVEPRTKVQISAQVSARIIALPFRTGDDVKKGDVVVRLDADDYTAQLQSAQANLHGEQARLAGLRAELANAKADVARVRGLFETKDVSRADLDAAEASYLRTEAAVLTGEFSIEIAQANIARAQKNLDLTTILAPMDGTITNLAAEVGEQVLGTFNNAGSVIMEIADLQNMILKAKIDEVNVVPVRTGQQARITVSGYRDRTFEGVVDLVGLKKQIERDGTGFFETEVSIKHTRDDGLRSGLTANVDIQVQTYPAVLKVPSQAVVDRRVDELPKELVSSSASIDKNKVFARVVYTIGADGKAKAIPVTIGSSDLTHTMILAGVAETDRVVTGPYRVLVTLKDGQAIKEEIAKTDEKKVAATPAAPSGS